METIELRIDLVTEERDGSCRLILVEGPWDPPDNPADLQRLAKRLADCLTAAINGHVTKRYPEFEGRVLTIQLDSYDTPKAEVDSIIAALKASIATSPGIQSQIAEFPHFSAIQFEHNWIDFAAEFERRERARKPGTFKKLITWLRGA